MINKKHIQNAALQLVTRQLPTARLSITDATPEREALLEMTNSAIQHVLRQFDWTFAQIRKKLTAEKIYTTNDEELRGPLAERYTNQYWGWANQYKLPPNYMGCLKIYAPTWEDLDNYTYEAQQTWWVEGQNIYTKKRMKNNEINISYTYYDSNKLNLPVNVELSMIYYLAHLIAPALIGSFETAERYYNLYTRTLLEAKTLDARERVPIVADNKYEW